MSPAAKHPPLLQSKENGEQSPYRADSDAPPSAHPSSAHPSSHDATQSRPVAVDGHDGRPPTYAPNAQPVDSRPSYPAQPQPPWSQHSQPQQGPPHGAYNSDHLPPFSEITRPESQHRSDYNQSSQRDMSRQYNQSAPPNNQQISNPSPQWHPPPAPQPEYSRQPPYVPPRVDTAQSSSSAAPAPVRMSSSSYSSAAGFHDKAGSKTFTSEEVERSRMLRGVAYNYFDRTLKNERGRCAQALARYNSACMLGSGVSETEAQNMLMKVFDPALDSTHSFLAPCKEKGILSPGVKIEHGFRCTYGYNLRIMDNVFIGESVRIEDSATVDIGARTWVGADVTILTNEVTKDLVQRKGSENQQCAARSVRIGPEVIIGSGAVIYPGVTIGRGATIEPFAVVRENLRENVTQKAAFAPSYGGAAGPGVPMS